ncbi:MAG: alanine:cation symporter family protein [Oscillospiraceae bacterium]|nr:alanine:cation symporter family protein [Oscillospiraceae bacterium]
MLTSIDNAVNAVSGILYKPYVVPLLLILAGLYFTFRLRFVQIRLFVESIRVVKEKPVNLGATSSFGALMVSTASRVGTGNIMGVSTALCLGGPGAIFWMWITAILGGASAFVESTLAQIYKKRDSEGGSYGGPSYYMEQGLGQRWLGVIFAIVLILTYVVGYNMLAAYNTQDVFSTFSFYTKSTPVIVGAVLAALFGFCVLGGGKRLTKVTEVLVPAMGVLYVLVSLYVVIRNFGQIPAVFGRIFRSAFDFKSILGGFTGSCVMWGIKRGLYSNEAGMGSAPNAAAAADVTHPAKQGLVQMLSVFIDTLLICSATAFLCLFSGVEPIAEAAGATYVQACTRTALGSFGAIFIAVAVCLFAFTTLLGNYYYTEGCLRFILKKEPGKVFMFIYRLCATALIFAGACISAGLAWDSADLLQALMVIINVPVIVILAKPAIAALRDYEWQRRKGKLPAYRGAANGVKGTDFWQDDYTRG